MLPVRHFLDDCDAAGFSVFWDGLGLRVGGFRIYGIPRKPSCP